MPGKITCRVIERSHLVAFDINLPMSDVMTARVLVAELYRYRADGVVGRLGPPPGYLYRFALVFIVVNGRVEILLHGEVFFARRAFLHHPYRLLGLRLKILNRQRR